MTVLFSNAFAGDGERRAASRRARVEVFGLPLDALTLDETVERVAELVESGEPHQHVVLNAAKVVLCEDDPEMRDIVSSCALVNADGQAVVWAARLLGHKVPERVAGIDLMDAVLARSASAEWPVYFLGATDDVVNKVVEVEALRHTGLKVAGHRNGFWTADEEAQVVADIAASGAKVLLVAVPTPRKERFLARHMDALGVPFQMGVGGSFDVVAGVVTRAPRWMQKAGLEWTWRLLHEPRRMFRRYLVGNSRFVWLTCREWWRGR
ncbi:MAG TPA: WecB/TagA/CpsF family glycosyltransferase [Mycobacteriales bacterium]|jgi:N-acetylglucosaminyldiphosphoundecaprenol N-acetyl-beta-D-mannosaminyltransferase